jgi:hypothetical protein
VYQVTYEEVMAKMWHLDFSDRDPDSNYSEPTANQLLYAEQPRLKLEALSQRSKGSPCRSSVRSSVGSQTSSSVASPDASRYGCIRIRQG